MDHSGKGKKTSGVGMMVPFLHFSGGDYLWLSIWAPSSKGQIAAACVGLFLMAVFERLVAAMRMMFDIHWHTRALAMGAARDATASYSAAGAGKQPATPKSHPQAVDSSPSSSENNIKVQKRESLPSSIPPRLPRVRTVPPFVAEHDIPRGILFAFQMFIGYLLMLAIMTFQAAYLLSIVLGLGVGQALFGRVLRASAGAAEH